MLKWRSLPGTPLLFQLAVGSLRGCRKEACPVPARVWEKVDIESTTPIAEVDSLITTFKQMVTEGLWSVPTTKDNGKTWDFEAAGMPYSE
jgi:hypothetical protein